MKKKVFFGLIGLVGLSLVLGVVVLRVRNLQTTVDQPKAASECDNEPSCCERILPTGDPFQCGWPDRGWCHPNHCPESNGQRCGLFYINYCKPPPSPPPAAHNYSLSSPANGTTGVSLSPTFTWGTNNPFSGGGYTNVNICNKAACDNPDVVAQCHASAGVSTCTYTGGALKANTQYWWLAYGYSGTEYWATSPIWSFTTSGTAACSDGRPKCGTVCCLTNQSCVAGVCKANTPPTPTTATITGSKIGVPNAQVTLDGGSPTTANPYTFSNLSAGIHRVIVTVPSGYTVKSTMCPKGMNCHTQACIDKVAPCPVMDAVYPGNNRSVSLKAGQNYEIYWHFTPTDTNSCTLGAPTLTAPAGAATNVDVKASYQWTPAGGAACSSVNTFTVYAGTNPDDLKPVNGCVEKSGTTCAWIGDGAFAKSTTYYWKVKAMMGGKSAESGVSKFTTDGGGEAQACWGNEGTNGKCYDCNGDGTVNSLDFSCFAKRWQEKI